MVYIHSPYRMATSSPGGSFAVHCIREAPRIMLLRAEWISPDTRDCAGCALGNTKKITEETREDAHHDEYAAARVEGSLRRAESSCVGAAFQTRQPNPSHKKRP